MSVAETLRLLGVCATSLAAVAATSGCFGNGRGITPVRTAFNRAVYLHSVGELEGAREEYREALEDDPTDFRARFNLALVLESLADRSVDDPDRARALRDEAAAAYDQVLEQRPENLRAAVNRAARYRADGEPGKAGMLLREAAEIHPDAALVHTALAVHELGGRAEDERLASLSPDDARRVEGHLRRALDAEPRDASANQLLARLRLARGDPEAARAPIRDALARAPDDLACLRTAARIEAAAGDHAASLAMAERLLLIDPDHRAAHVLAARAAAALGDSEREAHHLWAVRDLPARPGDPPLDVTSRLRAVYRELQRDLPPPAPEGNPAEDAVRRQDG